MNIDIRNIAGAVLNQALYDLKGSCAKMRNEAAEFLASSSPWCDALDLSEDYVRERTAKLIMEHGAKKGCSKLRGRGGHKMCITCGAFYS